MRGWAAARGPAGRARRGPAASRRGRDRGRALGYCNHKIFGRGKMVKFLPPDKYQVNFPGFGLKVIMEDFLTPEESS